MHQDRQPVSRTATQAEPASSESQPRPEDQLKYIRDVMSRSSTFTAVPGWGAVAMGVSAIVAALVAGTAATGDLWLAVWMIEACAGAVIGISALIRKARASNVPLNTGAGRKFLASFLPPLLAGAVLTIALWHNGKAALLPGLWMLMYGIGTVAGGAFSVGIVPTMGMLFLGAGATALFLPAQWGDMLMATSFGGFHLFFGFLIAKHHGG